VFTLGISKTPVNRSTRSNKWAIPSHNSGSVYVGFLCLTCTFAGLGNDISSVDKHSNLSFFPRRSFQLCPWMINDGVYQTVHAMECTCI